MTKWAPVDQTKTEFNQLNKFFETRYFTISNGEIIAYREYGRKDKYKNTVIFIHGNTACSVNMEPLMNELKHDCRVIAPCLRGTGYSSYHKPISTLKELA